MKVIISGVAGFIGSHLANRLLNLGYEVIGFDNLSRRGCKLNLDWLRKHGESFKFSKADVRSDIELDAIFVNNKNANVVFHEAAQVAVTTSISNPRLDFETNVLGTFNMLEATRKYLADACFVYASTNKVYGELSENEIYKHNGRYEYKNSKNGISESEPIDFHSPYGCSKGAADQYVRDYARIFGLKTVVFRQSCIYGTHQWGVEDQGWVAWFTIAAVLGKPITIYGDGKQVRDLLWVGDLLDLYLSAYAHIDNTAGNIYNAGGGPDFTLSLLELLQTLERLLNRKIDVKFDDWRPGDQRIFVTDCERAKNDVGWFAKTHPESGIKKLLDWVLDSRETLSNLFN